MLYEVITLAQDVVYVLADDHLADQAPGGRVCLHHAVLRIQHQHAVIHILDDGARPHRRQVEQPVAVEPIRQCQSGA